MMSNESSPGSPNENESPATQGNASVPDAAENANASSLGDEAYSHVDEDEREQLPQSEFETGAVDELTARQSDDLSANDVEDEDEFKGLFPWEIEAKQAEAELSPEEQARNAETDRLLLTHYGVFYSVVSITALGLAEGLGIPGADTFLRGLMVGCTMAVLNLHLLAKACWGALTGQRGLGSLAGFGLSFTLLMTAAYWLVRHHPEWLLGFGFGLTLPVLVGFSYAFHLRKEAKKVR